MACVSVGRINKFLESRVQLQIRPELQIKKLISPVCLYCIKHVFFKHIFTKDSTPYLISANTI